MIPNQEGLVVNLLLQEAMVLALPHAHVLARRASLNKALPLKALADEGEVMPAMVFEALRKYGLDSEKPNPVTV